MKTVSPTPFHMLGCQCSWPRLVGLVEGTEDQFIDLTGATIVYHPAQELAVFDGGRRIRFYESFPRTYTMTFTKRRKTDGAWINWFAENHDARFRVNNVEFQLESVSPTKRGTCDMRYTARGWESSPLPQS